MTLDDLKQIRLSRKRPKEIINLSLCRKGQFREPVIEIPHRKNFDKFDFRSLHGLAVDIHYWNRAKHAMQIIEIIKVVEPSSLFVVDHKYKFCFLIYWKGQSIFDDQSFLYPWEDRPYVQ